MWTVTRSLAAAGVCLLLAPVPSAAGQDLATSSVPPVDVSAGYAMAHDTTHQRTFPAGWYGSAAVNPAQWFGIAGEVSGTYSGTEEFAFAEGHDTISRRVYTVMAGPRFFQKVGRIVPFGQFLAGVAVEHESSTSVWQGRAHSGTLTWNRFAIQPGAGVTVLMTERVGIRAQADYRCVMDFEDEAEYINAFRFAAGFTLHWGGQ
jgi:hypothetical protein